MLRYAIWANIEGRWRFIISITGLSERDNILLSLGKYETKVL